VNLNGTSSYVDIPDNASLEGMDALTVSCWVKLASIPSQNVIPVGKEGAYRFVINSTGEIHLVVATGNNGWYSPGTQLNFGNDALSTETWYFLTATYDGNRLRAYLDGQPVGTGLPAISGTIIDNGSAVRFGHKSSDNIDYMEGRIDEVRIYNRALGDSEISSLYDFYIATSAIVYPESEPLPASARHMASIVRGKYLIINTGFQGECRIEIAGIDGRVIKLLRNSRQGKITLPAKDFSDGLYVVNIRHGDRFFSDKVLIVR